MNPQQMKLAYLIAAHAQPEHLRRLLAAIATDRAHAFVHIDKKSDLRPFAPLAGPAVTFCKQRVAVYWAEFSQVEATLALLRTALSAPAQFDYFVLLSGADYPLWHPAYIEDFFARRAGSEFLNMVAMPSVAANKPLSRLTEYKVASGQLTTVPRKVVRRLLRLAHLLPQGRDFRPAFRGLQPYGGSSWWALSRAACEYVLRFVEREKKVVKFFRNTWCPDEAFFQTILGNSPFQARVTHNVTYADWSAGGAHPIAIDERHLPLFAAREGLHAQDVYGQGELLFARKFSARDAALIAKIDAIIAEKSSALRLAAH